MFEDKPRLRLKLADVDLVFVGGMVVVSPIDVAKVLNSNNLVSQEEFSAHLKESLSSSPGTSDSFLVLDSLSAIKDRDEFQSQLLEALQPRASLVVKRFLEEAPVLTYLKPFKGAQWKAEVAGRPSNKKQHT